MTKFIDATDKKKVKKGKKTEFVKYIHCYGHIQDSFYQPKNFDYVKLLRRRDDTYQYDLFVAYDEGTEGIDEVWCLGHAGDEFEGEEQ